MIKKLQKIRDKVPFLKSLRIRIFTLLLSIGIIPSVVISYTLINNYTEWAVNVRASEVSNQFRIIANHLIAYNYLQDPSSEVINAELDQLSNLYDGRVLIINSNFKVVKDTYGISEGKYVISQEVIKCFKGENSSQYIPSTGFVEMTVPILDSAQGKDAEQIVNGVMLMSVGTDSIVLTTEILRNKAFIILFAMGIILIGISFVISKVLFEPFNKVTKAIKEVKEGYTDEALEVPDYEETKHIIEAFNSVLSRMRILDESRKEFVSNVSHELKTPLTSMKVLADSLIMQEDAPLELYQEFMIDIGAEIERENKIINDLLSLVKLDKTKAELNIETIDVKELIELILKRLRPIANKHNIEIIFECIRPIVAEIDEVKITLALSNLIENAIKYNSEEGYVHITLDGDHQYFTVEVQDSGIGIPEDSLEHIFERFYRVDKSHSREIGGTGLGLAITRNAILMHRGSVKVLSVEGEGSSFFVKIPLFHVK
ncbi:MAG: ATP-binding protein [Lachnospiraceae bacterium]